MKLISICKKCSKTIQVKESADDRSELYKFKGELIELKCKECNSINKYRINEIRATESKSVLIISFFVFLSGTIITFYFLKPYLFTSNNPYNILAIGSIFIIPSIIYMILNKQERIKVNSFNRHKI